MNMNRVYGQKLGSLQRPAVSYTLKIDFCRA